MFAVQLLKEIQGATESRMSPLMTEITDSRLKTRDAFDALYCKIVSYILQRSSVSSPADADSVNQAKGENSLVT